MRVLDIILTEAKQQIYAIGDSHAVAIANLGRLLPRCMSMNEGEALRLVIGEHLNLVWAFNIKR